MEQARYWTWAKRNPNLNSRHTLPPLPPAAMDSCGDSWEEQAFAEDAAGILGGCVWPPRFYSCSFCRREFSSAQALGGHMNVHRRDRARLKQSPAPQTEVVAQNHVLNPRTSFNAPYPPNMCAFLYNNPNPEFSDTRPLVSPLSHVVRVSSPSATKASVEEKTSTLCLLSPLDLRRERDSSDSSQPPSWSSFVADKRDRVLDSINYRRSNVIPSDSPTEREDCVSEDLSTSLHLVVCRRQTNASSDEEVGSCKRRRIEAKPSSFFPKSSAVDRCLPEPEVLKLRSGSSKEVLDLELRL